MKNRLDEPPESSIAELVHQLVEDARSFAQAEANLYKAIFLHRLAQAKTGAIALAAGGLLLLAGLITLLVMTAQGLAIHIGPVAAGIVIAAAGSLAGYLLFRYGARRLETLLGSEDEDRALRDGERKA